MKMYLMVIVLLFAYVSSAALTVKDALILRELSRDGAVAEVKKITKMLKKQKDDIVPSRILMAALNLKVYISHPLVEADTGLKKKWFQSLYDLISKMANVKSQQNVFFKTKDKKGYWACESKYSQLFSSYINLLKHPQKVDKKRLKALRRQARRIRRAIEEKANNK